MTPTHSQQSLLLIVTFSESLFNALLTQPLASPLWFSYSLGHSQSTEPPLALFAPYLTTKASRLRVSENRSGVIGKKSAASMEKMGLLEPGRGTGPKWFPTIPSTAWVGRTGPHPCDGLFVHTLW
mmetsp:Transcript_15573/g.29550  ORF Transcript_15573/g.29550 Transcript_15573/m.29550 type:complete len:125 (-) Transcript_15573:26-400(-)